MRNVNKLDNLTPSDVYYGRDDHIQNTIKDTKYKTMKKQRMKSPESKLKHQPSIILIA